MTPLRVLLPIILLIFPECRLLEHLRMVDSKKINVNLNAVQQIFSLKNSFSLCEQICQLSSYLLKQFLRIKFIFV